MSEKPSLIVEGGGMRGFFAAGILAGMLEAGVTLDYVVGVSSGALCAASYAARDVSPDFAALGNGPFAFFRPAGLLRPRTGVVRTDALIAALAGSAWEGLCRSAAELHVCATDARTAETVWWTNDDFAKGPEALHSRLVASASIPFVMPEAFVDGVPFADGGICDSIPLDRAEVDGYARHVMILTRPRGYVKPPQHLELYLRHVLRPYPALRRAMLLRHVRYNQAARAAERAEDEGRAFVLRMDEATVGRFEYAPRKLERAFDDGRRYLDRRMAGLTAWLGRG